MAEHTPGPWECHVNGLEVEVVAENEAGEWGLYLYNLTDGVALREQDARLIAAAPELLEALTRIAKVEDGYRSQMKFCDIDALGYFREFVRRLEDTGFRATLKQIEAGQ